MPGLQPYQTRVPLQQADPARVKYRMPGLQPSQMRVPLQQADPARVKYHMPGLQPSRMRGPAEGAIHHLQQWCPSPIGNL